MNNALVKVGIAGMLALGAALVPGVVPAGAQGETATLTVTKAVVGPVPSDAHFVIHVLCTDARPTETPISVVNVPAAARVVYDEDVTFGPSGGSKDFTFLRAADCTVTETNNGGATSTTGGGGIGITRPTTYQSVITNTFVATATTQIGTTTSSVASMAVAQPRFTG